MTSATFFKPSIVFVMSASVIVIGAMTMSANAQDGRAASSYTVRTLPLPDNGTGDVSMDYIAFDPATNSLWVPGGNTGAVDVVDVATGHVRQIPNLPTSQVQARGGTRVLGPSGVSIGDGVVYIGNRGGSEVCAFNSRTLARVACQHLDSRPDGVAYVAPTKEVWVTTPGEQGIRILDATTLAQKTKLTFPGNPEGYAVDANVVGSIRTWKTKIAPSPSISRHMTPSRRGIRRVAAVVRTAWASTSPRAICSSGAMRSPR